QSEIPNTITQRNENPMNRDLGRSGGGGGGGGGGTIDWEEFFRVLKVQGYDGYLGLDLGNRPTLVEDLKQSAAFVVKTAAEQGITIRK
ncbi:MAG: sugar phosphate isomerase/epimerase, partial [Phycisphaerales bacterium]|nr:sugar phosphate isomerase/epimerase [Phycisphaerales bacterium]